MSKHIIEHQATPMHPHTPPTQLAQPGAKKSKMPLTGLILSIAAVVTGIATNLSASLAFAGITLGTVGLAKKYEQKGKSIASIVLGGIALALLPVWIIVGGLLLLSLPDDIKGAFISTNVETSCYTVRKPVAATQEHEVADPSACELFFNEPIGLTGEANILVQPDFDETFAESSDKLSFMKDKITGDDLTVLDQKQLKIGDLTAYYTRAKNSTNQENIAYYIDVSKENMTLEGQPISYFIVSAFSSPNERNDSVYTIAESFKLKSSPKQSDRHIQSN